MCCPWKGDVSSITCSCFHLEKFRKRDSLWLIIFQISACIRVRTLFTACGPYILAGSWKDKVDTHQTLPPQHVPVCSVTQSCLWLFAILWTVAARVYPRQEYWSVLPFPPPGDLLDPEIELTCLLHLLKLAGGSSPLVTPGKHPPQHILTQSSPTVVYRKIKHLGQMPKTTWDTKHKLGLFGWLGYVTSLAMSAIIIASLCEKPPTARLVKEYLRRIFR